MIKAKIKTKIFPTINDIKILNAQGPWKTSTGSNLLIRAAFSFDWITKSFFEYDKGELAGLSEDIRGLRVYTVRSLPLGKKSKSGFHKIRSEMAIGIEGKVELECEDLFGNSKKFIITPENGIWMPPYILQTHQALEDNSGLLLIANTLFVAENKDTHDTFSVEEFKGLQSKIKSR
jgi:hypothetical protein